MTDIAGKSQPEGREDVIEAENGTDMGSYADAERAFLTKLDAWTRERQPSIDTAAGHKARDHREREALFQLGNAAAMFGWHLRAITALLPDLPAGDGELDRDRQCPKRSPGNSCTSIQVVAFPPFYSCMHCGRSMDD